MNQPPTLYPIDVRDMRQAKTRVSPPAAMSREELERLERQLIPAINTIRAALGKSPIIVPKD